ncbi:MAG: hypothetical protein HYU26_15250 [Candidatus Rokubacteria bacterium]|nr:hypothetical protein [Candidatus Rokubacteria bacterium]
MSWARPRRYHERRRRAAPPGRLDPAAERAPLDPAEQARQLRALEKRIADLEKRVADADRRAQQRGAQLNAHVHQAQAVPAVTSPPLQPIQ